MRKHRVVLILAALVLAAALGVTVTAAVQIYCYRLPDPALADREDLIRWLVMRDLCNESIHIQRTLASRLEEEFSQDIDWEATASQLDSLQRERLWRNVLVLLEPWFDDKVDAYFTLSPAERPTYVDRLLTTIGVWSNIESLRTDSRPSAADGEPKEASSGLLAVLARKTEQWKQRAEPDRRKQMNQFILAVQCRWLVRRISGDFPAIR